MSGDFHGHVYGDDDTRAKVIDEAEGAAPWLWLDLGVSAVSLRGTSGFARHLAEGASAWADAMEAHEGDHQDGGS